MITPSSERIVDDLRQVVEDAELLLREPASLAAERLDEARGWVADAFHAARDRLTVLEEEVLGKARDAAKDAERYVRDNPWQSVGLAAGIGLVIGVLISRR
ncbi:MAG: DUF883 domain-containing protein [Gammaproteobacteria bacterium]|nr:DUF883 domain-containing protein [Gammaproteobacteria bacterium]